jgi:hypothetical protein
MKDTINGAGEATLARTFRQLDDMGMSAAEREQAKDYLRRSEAVVEATARAWNRVRAFARGRLQRPSRPATRGA